MPDGGVEDTGCTFDGVRASGIEWLIAGIMEPVRWPMCPHGARPRRAIRSHICDTSFDGLLLIRFSQTICSSYVDLSFISCCLSDVLLRFMSCWLLIVFIVFVCVCVSLLSEIYQMLVHVSLNLCSSSHEMVWRVHVKLFVSSHEVVFVFTRRSRAATMAAQSYTPVSLSGALGLPGVAVRLGSPMVGSRWLWQSGGAGRGLLRGVQLGLGWVFAVWAGFRRGGRRRRAGAYGRECARMAHADRSPGCLRNCLIWHRPLPRAPASSLMSTWHGWA